MKYLRSLSVQVLLAIVLGVTLGVMASDWAVPRKPLGDRFMSEARAITNFIGNTVATLVVSKWDGSFDATTPEAQKVLRS